MVTFSEKGLDLLTIIHWALVIYPTRTHTHRRRPVHLAAFEGHEKALRQLLEAQRDRSDGGGHSRGSKRAILWWIQRGLWDLYRPFLCNYMCNSVSELDSSDDFCTIHCDPCVHRRMRSRRGRDTEERHGSNGGWR